MDRIIRFFVLYAWLIPLITMYGVFRIPEIQGFLSEVKSWLVGCFRLKVKLYQPVQFLELYEVFENTQNVQILVSEYGIFVVHLVSFNGKIYGNFEGDYWLLGQGGRYFRFWNPVQLNQERIDLIVEKTGIDERCVHSLIAFTGNAKFETLMPNEVFKGVHYIKHICSFNKPVFTSEQAQELLNVLRSMRKGLHQHKKQKPAHATKAYAAGMQVGRGASGAVNKSKDEGEYQRLAPQQQICPNCGSEMMLKQINKGLHKGVSLWGCTAFPKCQTLKWAS